MAEIHLTLPEPLNEFVQSQIAAGRYASVSDYVRELVLADQHQQEMLEKLGDHPQLDYLLEQGMASADGRRWSAEVLNDLKQKVIDAERKARTDG